MPKITIIVILCTMSFAQTTPRSCPTGAMSAIGGWMLLESAPKDGTVVEVLNTYGIAPHYSLNRWTKVGDSNMQGWVDLEQDHNFLLTDSKHCFFWRPYNYVPGKKYVDPTGGAQDKVAYECAWMHVQYNRKTGYCE
jgi:hypothetical protein